MAWFTLPQTFLLACAVILAFVEFTIGTHLLFGINRRGTARVATVFMAAMTILTTYIAIANPVSDCGCFGDVIILSNEETLAKNIILLAASIFICRFYRLQKDFLTAGAKWFIVLISFCFIIGYAIYCVVFLPCIDFRPYKIGTNLLQSATTAGQEYDVKIIYTKDGETLELTLEDEDPDSTWTYVETRQTPLETTDNTASDFHITDEYGNDITADILAADEYAFLLIVPHLTSADEGCVGRINEVYDFSQDHGTGFYCLTSSSEPEAQAYWTDHTGAEYNYYITNDRILKTVVRAQPGLLLLHNGIIIKKWSNYNMPNENDLLKDCDILAEK
jgi:triosephosphate isomerase